MTDIDYRSHLGPAELAELDLLMQTLASLGVTPDSIQKSGSTDPGALGRSEYRPLDNDEWMLLKEVLPNDPSQSNAMDNRAFVNAVLEAMHRGGRWNERRKQGFRSDAVRRRFGRWAHLGIWQRAYDAASDSELSSERKSALKLVAQRAERLRHNLL